jgi:hypothetical protein
MAAVVMVLTAGATPAHAGNSNFAYTRAGNGFEFGNGLGDFYDLTETWTLWDYAADGAGVIVQWKINDVSQPTLYNGNGLGSQKEFDFEIAEGAVISFRVCLRDNGVIQTATCSLWSPAKA